LRKGEGDYSKSLAKTAFLLRKGYDVLFFPTARIGEDFKPQDARPGVAWLAKKINPTIVPVLIKDTHKIGFMDYLLRRRHVSIKFGKPFKATNNGYSIKDYKDSAKEIMTKVSELK
jgi:1-acyl-sn-glycerol-3-phosphate acyltransferase